MKLAGEFLWNLLWLALAGLAAYFFLKSFLAAELLCGVATFALRHVEKAISS
ncbi:MAG TPA: hypothetical protein VGA40_05375 [Candidatus Acidoferrales bacterium]